MDSQLCAALISGVSKDLIRTMYTFGSSSFEFSNGSTIRLHLRYFVQKDLKVIVKLGDVGIAHCDSVALLLEDSDERVVKASCAQLSAYAPRVASGWVGACVDLGGLCMLPQFYNGNSRLHLRSH